MRVHKLTFAALAVAAGLSLTACQNDDGGTTGQSDPSAASTASSQDGGTGAGSGSGQGGGAQSSDGAGSAGNGSAGKGSSVQGTAAGSGSGAAGGTGKAAWCRTDELEITAVDDTIDGDPDRTVAVTMKNHGGRDCTISGYAGVDLKLREGTLSAQRTGEKAASSILKNGQSIAFGIHYPSNDTGGSGVRVTGLLVTPPNETRTVTLKWPGAATLPVTDETTSRVTVGPVGSAGQGG
ncbi:DUF4232 domain-containing protein [Streptomyces sp. NEAU-sy36]|uniref:DUF4232 domain-containing protein n=1 Tax=unclassified Streptomyces TaxID=2593676 RepID=UPI0015D5F6E7|nr:MULTISPECIES: DUF4232 domain-containing protein [unclassified Streptomyces]QLJ02635.1 DUF4232 domain-containing protein [Streptomyces sp. NEAU-sy36]